MKNNKGITLIALIITIIVLLILAGISISLILGDNGILSKSQSAKKRTTISDVKETAEIIRGEYEVNNNGKNPTSGYIIEKLIDQNKIKEEDVVEYGDETGIGIIIVEGQEVEIRGGLIDLPTFSVLTKMTSYDYYYEEGMTWREWINSRYNNNDRCEIKIEDIYLDGGYKECIIGDLGFGRFIFIVTEDTEQFLDSLVYPAGLFGNHLLSIKTEEISQFYGQKWQNVWNDPSFIAYKEKYNLIIIDEERRNTEY